MDGEAESDAIDGNGGPVFMQDALLWMGGAGVCLASGPTAVATMGEERGIIGSAMGLAGYAVWPNLPPEGSQSRPP